MIRNAEATRNLVGGIWLFKLYVCGDSQRALNTYINLKRVCDERLDGQYRIEVVDLRKNPQFAFSDNITACPTVIKESPSPKRVVIGDLSKTDVVLAKLGLPPLPLMPEFSKGAKSVSFVDFSECSQNFEGFFADANFGFFPGAR